MAYETGTLTDIPDLILKLSTFLVANGWTEDQRDNTAKRFAFHKVPTGGALLYFSGRWGSDTANIFSLCQALGYTGGNAPGNHPNDSGNGYNATSGQTRANLDDERNVDLIGVGPYPRYWFFEQDASPCYIHVVIEVAAGTFVHFGCGELKKFNDWTGGEYLYGHQHPSSNTNALLSDSSILLDGFASTSGVAPFVATIHIEGLSNQAVGGKWGLVWASDTNLGTDTAAVARAMVQGGFRGGPIASELGNFLASLSTGFVPMYPIALFHVNGNIALASGVKASYLGHMADVRGVHLRNFAAAQEVSIGGDTWIFFPSSIRVDGAVARGSGYQGIAYKKVTA
jgi:hypothetical protein